MPSHINAEIIGESARDSALPWDTIPTTVFRAGSPLSTTIDSLTATYEQRAKDDPNFRYQLDMIQAAEDMSSRTSVSLNKETRTEEREQELQARLDRENERRRALDLPAVESLDDIEEDDFPDILLDQAAGIITDLATMREIAGPEHTAQVQR